MSTDPSLVVRALVALYINNIEGKGVLDTLCPTWIGEEEAV